MGILAVHEYLAETLLPSVQIAEDIQGFDDEVSRSIVKAYSFFPDIGKPLAAYPAATLNHELQAVFFRPSGLEEHYAIHLQVYVHPIEANQGLNAAVASALLKALIETLSSNQKLGGTVSVIRGIRGAAPDTIVSLTWAGKAFVGLDLFIDVTLFEGKEHRA